MTYQSAVIYFKEKMIKEFFLSKMNAGIKGWDVAMAGMNQLNFIMKSKTKISEFEDLKKLVKRKHKTLKKFSSLFKIQLKIRF